MLKRQIRKSAKLNRVILVTPIKNNKNKNSNNNNKNNNNIKVNNRKISLILTINKVSLRYKHNNIKTNKLIKLIYRSLKNKYAHHRNIKQNSFASRVNNLETDKSNSNKKEAVLRKNITANQTKK